MNIKKMTFFIVLCVVSVFGTSFLVTPFVAHAATKTTLVTKKVTKKKKVAIKKKVIAKKKIIKKKTVAKTSPVTTIATVPTPTIAPTNTNPSYSLADVSAHNGKSSCWTIINGNVYDLTTWIAQHPGGEGAIISICGKNGSSAFDNQHGTSGRPEQILKTFQIGIFK